MYNNLLIDFVSSFGHTVSVVFRFVLVFGHFAVILFSIVCLLAHWKKYHIRCLAIGLIAPFLHMYLFDLINPRYYFRPAWTFIWLDDPLAYCVASVLSLQTLASLLLPPIYGYFICRLFLLRSDHVEAKENLMGLLWATAGFAFCAFLIVGPYVYMKINYLGADRIP